MKLIHITDIHLTVPGEELFGLNPHKRFEAAVADINAHHRDAELCVITGDLTHWGEQSAYEWLRDTLEQLQVPWRLLMGNHDERSTFQQVFPDVAVDDNGFIQDAFDTSAGRFILLDTLREGTHAGGFCVDRQAWLRGELRRSAGSRVFLFMHHPPFDIGIESLDRIGLAEAHEFGQIVDPYADDIRHLFFGHVHRPIAGSWHGIPFTVPRGTNHQCWLDFEGNGQILGSHEPPAYCIAFLTRDAVVTHYHDYLDASPKYDMGSTDYADWAKQDESGVVAAQ